VIISGNNSDSLNNRRYLWTSKIWIWTFWGW